MSCNQTDSPAVKLAGVELALVDARLYLDTHRDDPTAMTYFSKKLAARQPLAEDYIKKVGPLTMFDFEDGTDRWATDMWPWQMEE